MSKHHKKKDKKIMMKEWPEEENLLVAPKDLIDPLKSVILEGYEVKRIANKTDFHYKGYNIGANDWLYSPTPVERFSTRWLYNEAKFNRTLLDNVLMTVFQMGMEQGRRLEKPETYNTQQALDILRMQTKRLRRLEQELSLYDVSLESAVDLSDNEMEIEEIDGDEC